MTQAQQINIKTDVKRDLGPSHCNLAFGFGAM